MYPYILFKGSICLVKILKSSNSGFYDTLYTLDMLNDFLLNFYIII